jgi:hypothetical protein
MQTINEKTTYVVNLAFKDENEAPVTPNSAQYSLYNYTANFNVKDLTTITITGSNVDLEIPYSDNSIIKSTNDYEVMLLTVQYVFDTDKRGTSEHRYLIKNLKKIS